MRPSGIMPGDGYTGKTSLVVMFVVKCSVVLLHSTSLCFLITMMFSF